MSENWRNNKYGTLENSGKERAFDYGGGPDYFAPVRAVILLDSDENIIGERGSPVFITGDVVIESSPSDPVFITGDVFLTNDPVVVTGDVFLTNNPVVVTGDVFITNNPVVITGDVFLTNDPVVITGDVFLTNDPVPISGDVQLFDDLDNIIGIRGSPVFITGNVSDEWEIAVINDVVPSENDKRLDVPSDREYQVLSIAVDYSAFGDAGTRQLEIDFRDENDNIFAQIRPGVVQTANTTGHYVFAPSLADHLAFRDTDYLMTPLPPTVFLQPDEDMRIWDNNDITANDTMVIRVRVAERSII